MNFYLLENSLINVAFAFLLVALILYWISIMFTTINTFHILAKFFTFLTNLSLTISLLIRWINYHYFPLSNLYESLIFLTWSFTFIHLILEYQNNSKLIGAISTPIALFTIAFASLSLPIDMQKPIPLVPALRSNWLMMHVSIMMISYSALILGSLLSILFLALLKLSTFKVKEMNDSYNVINNMLQYNNKQAFTSNNYINDKKNKSFLFKQKNFLRNIDNLSYRIIGLGFLLLTIGIIAGAVWANQAWGSYWSWDPKETWALITWLVFASYLHARLNTAWQGEKPAILATLGFIVVWICYLGVNFLGKGLHSYGWIS
uniref:Cytochrome c biogenesis protein CcsA n=1 Tax=Gastroclonium compressum TaxID=1852973 RepID=A0A173FZY3_GASCM|nr:cytochrome c heme attachment protein [Coeloseira compressa]ANH09577.1 cytochrome c heme attachment protein [Coeloseira compressa]